MSISSLDALKTGCTRNSSFAAVNDARNWSFALHFFTVGSRLKFVKEKSKVGNFVLWE